MDAGFSQADIVVEENYETQPVEHAYLEPEAGLAYVDHDDVVTVVSPSQNITHHRHMLAKIIDKPIHKVRFIMSPVGGGFGGKEDMIYQGMLALAAMKTGRPVRLVFTREESIISTAKRHPARISLKMGLTREGRITAAGIQDDFGRRRVRDVDRRSHAQGGDFVLRPVSHPECAGRHFRRLHEQYAKRRIPDIRRDAGAVRDRIAFGHLRGKTPVGSVRDQADQHDARRLGDPHAPKIEFSLARESARRRGACLAMGAGRAMRQGGRANGSRRRRHEEALHLGSPVR